MKFHALRLHPGQDLKCELMNWVQKHNIKAASVLSGLGSLEKTHIRYANASSGVKESGHFEILTLSGLFSIEGGHFHISIANNFGHVFGGHLLEGNIIFTTAEITIAELTDHNFKRSFDAETGFKELQITSKDTIND